jgi:predicted anti-sigma-YlaC factor YlaD
VTCDECRQVLSAGLDGEAEGVELAEAGIHLDRCAACRAFEERVRRLHRATRLAPAPAVPDLGPEILAAIGRESRGRERITPLRLVLAVVAVLEIGAALPALLLGDDAQLSAHAARHAGSFALAIGVGFLYAALRPRRATGVLVVAGALMGCLVLASVLDVATGRAAALSEAQHVPEVIGVLTVWLLHRQVADADVGLA